MTPIQRRVLAYLDQRGPTHRQIIVNDLVEPTNEIRRRIGVGPQAAAMIMGSWCKKLERDGLLRCIHKPHRLSTRGGGSKTLHFYEHHEITDAGRAALRSEASA